MCVPTAIYGLTSGNAMQLTASSNSKRSAIGGALLGGVLVAIVTFFPVLLGMYGAAVYHGNTAYMGRRANAGSYYRRRYVHL